MLIFLAACVPIYIRILQNYAGTTGFAGRTTAGAMFWNIVTCFDRLILEGWDYEHYGPPVSKAYAEKGSQKSVKPVEKNVQFSGTRMEFGSEVTGNPRGIGTSWEAKNVPPFSRIDPSFIPSRTAFLLAQAVTIVGTYQLNNFTVETMAGVDPTYLADSYVPLLTRLPSVSYAEFHARVVISIGYWIVQYCNMQFFCSLFGVSGVLTNPKNLRLWRPLFGPPSDAMTIRDAWG